jgi:hypothetical protein
MKSKSVSFFWNWSRILSLMLGCWLCATVNVAGQTPTVEANKPLKAAFDHDGLNVTSFLVLLSGKQVAEVPATARVGGVVTVDLAALAPGAYTIIAVARNAPVAPFTDPTDSPSVAYAFEAHVKAPKANPPAWRATVLIMADSSVKIETIEPVVDPVQVVWLQRDGSVRVVSELVPNKATNVRAQ